jgi:hypothetical protein
MKSVDTSAIDSYFALLKSLSHNAKLELISRLSQSMQSKKPTEDVSWKSLFGALELDIPVEDFIQELKTDRKFNSKSINL